MLIRRRRLGGMAVGAGCWLAMARAASAAGDIKVGAKLSARRVQMGESVYLRITVQAEGDGDVDLPTPSLRQVDGLHIESQGPPSVSQSMMVVNGRAHVSRSHTYDFAVVPQREGKFAFDARITVDGSVQRVDVPTLEVVAGQTAGAGDPLGNPQERGDLFLLPSVDRQRVYVGEPVVYTFELWTRVDDQVQMRTLPTFKDFWTEDLPFDDEPRRASLDGQVYRVHPLLQRALFPQKAGRLTIGAGEVEAHPSAFASLFGRRRRAMPRLIRGPGVEIEALPLPAAGQPPGFASNNVGRFTVSAAVDRDQVAVGEGLTLTITVAGTGNLRFVEPGAWAKLDGARRYDPQDELDLRVDDEGQLGGERRYKFLIVPEAAGDLVLPAHTLHFFDPRAEAYASAQSQPITIEVTGGAKPSGVQEAVAPEVQNLEAIDDAVFAPIIEQEPIPRVSPRPKFWTLQRFGTAVVAAPATAALVWAGVAVRRRFGPDDEARRQAERAAQRKALLDKARAAVGSGEGFFAAIGEVLHGFVVEQCGEEGVGLSREHLLKRLRERGVNREMLDATKAVLDRADAARFGVDASTADERQACLQQVQALLDASRWRPTASGGAR